jgi:hypothetical protein
MAWRRPRDTKEAFTFAGDFHRQMKQIALNPDRSVKWVCAAGHDNWQDNGCTFTLEPRKSETLLTFSQDYARELSDETYEIYNFNWGYYLNSLKQFVEKNSGVRPQLGLDLALLDAELYSSASKC